jgi:tetratricopeptide (TPR) repeat protein
VPRATASADYFLLLLESLLKLNRVDEARSLAAEFSAANRTDDESLAKFALLLAGSGLRDEALNLLGNSGRASTFHVLYALGVINASGKNYDGAERYLNDALRARPEDVQTLRALARVARARGELEKAMSLLVRARRLAPDSRAVLYDFGATALQMDLLLDALNAFEKLHRERPREPAYLFALATTRLRKGDAAEAAQLMKTYVGGRPEDAAGFYLLGDALQLLNQYAAARVALERSLKLSYNADAEYLLGVTLEKEGKRAEAVAALARVVSARPDHAAAQVALGAAYREEGEFVKARAVLERAIALDQTDLRAFYQLGLVLSKLGDKDGAKKMFERADDLRGQQRNRESVTLKLIDPPEQEN